MRKIGNHIIRNSNLGGVALSFKDEFNSTVLVGRSSVVMPTELTLPANWEIPSHKKLTAWRQGEYEYKPGKAVNISLIDISAPFEAVYIDCFIIQYINPFDNITKSIKYAAGALVTDFISQTNFSVPEGMTYKGMLSKEDNIVYQKRYIFQDETLVLYCEKS